MHAVRVGVFVFATDKFLKGHRNFHSPQYTTFPKSLSNPTELLMAQIFQGFLTVTVFLLERRLDEPALRNCSFLNA
jgi:hypothetical protein